jgi:hypothetical protein
MDIRYVTPLLSGLRLKKGPFVLFGQAVYSESGVRYARSITFREEGVLTERKTYEGRSDSSRIIVGKFIPCFS